MVRAGKRRLRPIMMTALATIAGMVRWRAARVADAATFGDRGDRRDSGFDGAIASGDAGGSLLSGRPKVGCAFSRRRSTPRF